MNNIFTIFLNLYLLLSIPVYWNFHIWNNYQQNYFVFGILGLYCLTFFVQPKRKLNDVWIGLFVLLSLANIFAHNYRISGIAEKYINYSLASEGFLYVLCGALLYKLIYEYGEVRLRNYPSLWFALSVWIIRAFAIKSFTPIVSLVTCLTIYFFIKKKYTIAYFMFLPITIGILKFWYPMWLKLQARLWTNVVLVKDIVQNPLGKGFDNSFKGNVIFCDMFIKWGHNFNALDTTGVGSLIYPHNDYLNIARDLGIVALIIIGIFLYKQFKTAKIIPLTFLCLAIAILCCFQTTMYFAKNAVLFLPIFAILRIKNAESV